MRLCRLTSMPDVSGSVVGAGVVFGAGVGVWGGSTGGLLVLLGIVFVRGRSIKRGAGDDDVERDKNIDIDGDRQPKVTNKR